jgi:hypothetical protein
MTALLAGLLAVPLLDHAVKRALLARLAARPLSLGRIGAVGLVRSRVRAARPPLGLTPAALWAIWLASAAALALVTARHPGFGWSAGLLLGGALSHALETSARGAIHDYVRLGRWPAFDLADAALTLGALGMGVHAVAVARAAWP